MRVPVIRQRVTAPRDERGAAAVLVGILAVFLVGLSAFTVDLGAAYVSNRNLQKAADAGALAAAQSLTKVSGHVQRRAVELGRGRKCRTQLAISVAKMNYPDASWAEDGTWRSRATRSSRSSPYQFGNSGVTDARFAAVFGVRHEDHDDPHGGGDGRRRARRRRERAAAGAVLGVARSGNMRASGDFVRSSTPAAARVSAASAKPSTAGNWWTHRLPRRAHRRGSTRGRPARPRSRTAARTG